MSSPPALSTPARLRWWLSLLVGIGWLLGQDAAGRLSFESVFVAGDAAQNQVTSYSYNAANNRTDKTLVSGSGASSQTETWSYSYNSLNQLVGMTKTTAAGVEVVSYGYDANGNRTSRTASSGIDHYRWDEENRLQSTTKGAQGWRYGYDYRTRRVSIQEGSGDPTGSQFVLNKVTAVVFRDGVSVSEYEGATEAVVRADAAVPTVSYVRGPDLGGGVGGLVASLRYTGAGQAPLVRYNLSNGRGDVVAQTDASGTVTWTGSYEGFGTRTAETGTNLDRQRANTKEEDPTGLLNEGFRYRDLETGTWLSRDPAGFVDGPNLYAYVQQNPWTKFDPEGLFWSALVTVAFAAYDTYQYATGQTSGAEYSQAMALNGAALAADATTGGMGGGLAVRAANAAAKAAKVIDKANNAYETGKAVLENGGDLVSAIGEGDGKGALRAAANLAVDAGGGKKGKGQKGNKNERANTETTSGQQAEDVPKVEIHRGVHASHPDLPNAKRGEANPMGGPSSAEAHTQGELDSDYTSWTTDRSFAEVRADRSGPGGVVLTDKVPQSQLIRTEASKSFPEEAEVLRKGKVEGATVDQR